MAEPFDAVLFDAVGTVLQPSPPAPTTYALQAARHGVELPVEEVARRFRAAFRRQEEADRGAEGCRTDEAREVARWRAIVGETFPECPRPEALFRDLWERFAEPSAWEVFPEVAAALAGLTGRGIAWGLASNFDGRLRTVAAGFPALAGCRRWGISSEIGYRKPSPHYFEAVFAACGVRPERVLFVGDDLDNDFRGARRAGAAAALLARDGRAKSSDVPTYPDLTAALRAFGLM